MNKSEFDQIIKRNLAATAGSDTFGYKVFDGSKEYETYYCNNEFAAFKREMKSLYGDAYRAYSDGKGSELIEQTGRYGAMPPKMASVASSSRFCYLALRKGAASLGSTGGVEFEHECRISGIAGIAPQLDAYAENGNIYVEAKCHEIFDPHRVVLKMKYWNLVCGEGNQFGLDPLTTADSSAAQETFEIPLSVFEVHKPHSMFDTKQFLCHLLGIACQPGESKKLVYLFFMPETNDAETQAEIKNVFAELQNEIHCIFGSAPIQNFCVANHIELRAVAESSYVMEALTQSNMKALYPVDCSCTEL